PPAIKHRTKIQQKAGRKRRQNAGTAAAEMGSLKRPKMTRQKAASPAARPRQLRPGQPTRIRVTEHRIHPATKIRVTEISDHPATKMIFPALCRQSAQVAGTAIITTTAAGKAAEAAGFSARF